jgi:hypothetical protein
MIAEMRLPDYVNTLRKTMMMDRADGQSDKERLRVSLDEVLRVRILDISNATTVKGPGHARSLLPKPSLLVRVGSPSCLLHFAILATLYAILSRMV